jgi:hypothetical protein
MISPQAKKSKNAIIEHNSKALHPPALTLLPRSNKKKKRKKEKKKKKTATWRREED